MQLAGEIKDVIFASADTGYTVLDMKCEDSVFTVVGTFPPVSEGMNIRVEGKFQTRTTYGKQFVAEKVWVSAPSRLEGIKKFLGSGLISGLGPVTAQSIVDMFGVDSLEMMKYPMELAKVRGISLKRATEFGMNYAKVQKMQDAVMFLQNLGISVNMSLKIYRTYDIKTVDNVRKNPYMLVDDVDGIGFATADRIAGELGIEKDSDYRICAAITYLLKEAATRSGHNYLPENELLSSAITLLNIDCDDIEQRVRDNMMDMVMLGDLVRYETKEHAAILLKKNFNTEKNIAKKLLQLKQEASDFRVNVESEVASFERSAGFSLHENQIAAVKETIENGVQIVTGGPGTGKTTIVKCILKLFKDLGQKVALCAPTGRAAKRLSQATGEEAKTIHRMLEVHGMQDDTNARGDERENLGMFERNSSNPLEADAVIIDEMSMVDITLFHSLLLAIPEGCRLILVGDINQLPSVGPGNVLHDIINSKAFSEVCLTKIFRQAASSDIVVNAHKINHGEEVKLDNKSEDFFFMERNDADHIIKIMLDLVQTNLPKYVNASPYDIQILTPTRKGRLGVESLNAIFQRYLNPKSDRKTEYVSGDRIFREGDKVMQIKNNYQLEWTVQGSKGITTESGTGVFNGDTGIVKKINLYDSKLTVEYEENRLVDYDLKELSDLELAYAVTVHKSQGSEYPAVVIPMMQVPRMLMNRNILYTAVTRAKKCVVMVGEEEVFRKMVANGSQLRRYSGLEERIQEEIEKRTGLS